MHALLGILLCTCTHDYYQSPSIAFSLLVRRDLLKEIEKEESKPYAQNGTVY